MATKITKRDNFNKLLAIPAVAEDEDMVAFINHEIELLDKQKSADKKPTARQTENANLAPQIIEYLLTLTEPVSTSDIAKHFDVSTQRMTPLLGTLQTEGKVDRSVVKGKVFFNAVRG